VHRRLSAHRPTSLRIRRALRVVAQATALTFDLIAGAQFVCVVATVPSDRQPGPPQPTDFFVTHLGAAHGVPSSHPANETNELARSHPASRSAARCPYPMRTMGAPLLNGARSPVTGRWKCGRPCRNR